MNDLQPGTAADNAAPPSDTRQRLLVLMLELFAARGYEAVGIQELCQRGSISKPTLYYHFGSKLGCLRALIDWQGGLWLARLATAAEYRHDIVLTLRGLLQTALDLSRNAPDFARLLLGLTLAAPDSEGYLAIRPVLERTRALLEAVFLAAAADHGNMRGREKLLAELFAALLAGRMAAALRQPDHAEDIHRTIHQFMHGIFS